MTDFIERTVFEFSGGREMVNVTRLQELLIPLEDVKDPKVLRLSNKSFSKESAEILASRLVKFKNLEVADISDIIAGIN